jgi:hypothetical protein
MKSKSIALMIYGEAGSGRNAITEEKYKRLASGLLENDFAVDSVLYHDSIADRLATDLLKYNAILVWVNPIEQQNDRKILDKLLVNLASQGCFVSAHPDTILKIGTKEIIYKTRETEFGGDVKLYHSFPDFKERFLLPGGMRGIRILKQYRGNGGNGVFKIDATNFDNDRIGVTHATDGGKEEQLSINDFFRAFESYFSNRGMLIDQQWNSNLVNGMVRCYLSGNKVAGFGYQEVNAFYPNKKPSQRFYFSEDCGLFRDLRNIMESKWISELQEIAGVKNEMLPLIWDADFFINKVNTENTNEKYSLCEINASCVSPFPESSIRYIVEAVKKRI